MCGIGVSTSMPTDQLILIIIALIGLCFGSMVTLVSYRLPRGLPVGMVRSECQACKTPLGFKDLFPLLSWLTAKGKCRHCGAGVSIRYPLIELVTMAATLAVYFRYGVTPQAIMLVTLSVCLMIMIVVDLEHYLLPDVIQLILAALGIAYNFVTNEVEMVNVFAGGLLGLLIGAALAQGYRFIKKQDGLGMGDVKFLGVAGLWLGSFMLPAFAFYSGMLGIVLALLWRAAGRGKIFPFGPALAVALWALAVFPETGIWFWQVFQAG